MTIQIIDNNPDGIRICRVDGESLVTVVVPRDMLGEAKCLPDLPDRGVYYLLDEDHGVLSRVYAGKPRRDLSDLMRNKTKRSSGTKPSCSSITMSISTVMFWTRLRRRPSIRA